MNIYDRFRSMFLQIMDSVDVLKISDSVDVLKITDTV